MSASEHHKRWDRLLETFRGFGGIADNVIQRPGPLGLGVFPIEPAQPIELRVPEHLLIPVERIALQDGSVILKNDRGFPQGYADWFQSFQAHYSWGAEARQHIQVFENSMQSLPSMLREQLSSLGLGSQLNQIPQTTNQQHIFDRFVETRQIQFNNSMVLMPIIELINHSPQGKSWEINSDSIAASGSFDDEILIRYSFSDPLRRLIQYYFNCKEPTGFSVNLRLKYNNLNIFVVGGINFQPEKPCAVKSHHTQIYIYKPLLGSAGSPKMPRILFRKSLKNLNIDADELFERIQHLNRIALIRLLENLESVPGPASTQLKTACLDQLVVLSCHKGI